MEEVDKIIIQTLKSLGCELEDFVSIGQFGVKEVNEGIVRCLSVIDSSCELPTTLPHNMAQRFRAAGAVAATVKNVGYSTDIGYQSLLYPNELDLRKLFIFLIDKLPKDTSSVTHQEISKKVLIQREAAVSLKKLLSRPWVPPHCRRVAYKRRTKGVSCTEYGTFHCKSFKTSPFEHLGFQEKDSSSYDKGRRSFSDNYDLSLMKTSLLNSHAVQIYKEKSNAKDIVMDKGSDKFVLEPLVPYKVMGSGEIGQHSSSSVLIDDLPENMETNEEIEKRIEESLKQKEEMKQKEREEKITNAQQDIETVTKNMNKMTLNIQTTKDALLQLKEDIDSEQLKHEDLKKDLKTKQRISSLIPDAVTNIQRLQTALTNSEEKMKKLQKQWDDHRIPLEQQLNQLKHKSQDRKNDKQRIIDEVTDMRDKMKLMVEDATKKEASLVQLKQQHEAMKKDVNRSVYTKRINDISAKVTKQKQEIDKVISDTKVVQKEINILIGKLERTFALVDSVAYKEAISNEKARPVYRSVVSVHEGCGELVEIIRETGIIQREISDLQEQLNLEKRKKVKDHLQQLTQDLTHLKQENLALKQKLTKSKS